MKRVRLDGQDAKNDRRCTLIDKEIAGVITPEEAVELASLQEGMFMATTPVQNPLMPVPAAETTEQRFRQLESQWTADTRFLSDPGKIMAHPAMRAIIEMGGEIVPTILRDLQAKGSLMVWALPEITGENLAPPRIDGGLLKVDVKAQIETWLKWGRDKGLI